jgi:hypothetical protein
MPKSCNKQKIKQMKKRKNKYESMLEAAAPYEANRVSNYGQTRENIQQLLMDTIQELGLHDEASIKYVTDMLLRYKDFQNELYTIVEHEVRNNMEDIRS